MGCALENFEFGEAGPLEFGDEVTLRQRAGHSAGPGDGVGEDLGWELFLGDGQVSKGELAAIVEQGEVYLVVRGTLTLLVEEEKFELAEGELARVPPTLRRHSSTDLQRRAPSSRSAVLSRVTRPGRAHPNVQPVLIRIRGTAALGGVSSAWTLPFIRHRW
jgi:hypothetical protein